MRNLSTEWTQGLSAKDKETLEQTIRNSTTVLTRLLAIVEERDQAIARQECAISDYDTPNWAVRQAHRNGERSQLRKLKDLLSFLKG